MMVRPQSVSTKFLANMKLTNSLAIVLASGRIAAAFPQRGGGNNASQVRFYSGYCLQSFCELTAP